MQFLALAGSVCRRQFVGVTIGELDVKSLLEHNVHISYLMHTCVNSGSAQTWPCMSLVCVTLSSYVRHSVYTCSNLTHCNISLPHYGGGGSGVGGTHVPNRYCQEHMNGRSVYNLQW